ncbi:MAG: exosortase E/protease, VPEID-CTERM system [Neomegalonema sp.]|nr:exosortase E/protease, VPEID-CTERM system [Neomegalonema sp.]
MAASDQFPPRSTGISTTRATQWAPRTRFASLVLLAAGELLLLSLFFSLDFVFGAAGLSARVLMTLANALPLSMIMAGALLGVGLARPGALQPLLQGAERDRRGALPAIGHFVGFASFAAILTVTQIGGLKVSHDAILAGLLAASLLAGVSFARLIAPLSAWIAFIRAETPLLIAAAATALTAIVLGTVAQDYWRPLSDATLTLSRLLLNAATSDVVYDPAARMIGAGDFKVLIAQQCSGYEGVALVLSFLAFFGYVFRAELRFPHFLLLAPIGVVVIWLSNSFRIAALVLVGSEISGPLAAGGFHSFAGLALFLVVSLTLSLIALRMPFFRRDGEAPARRPEATPAQAERVRLADAMLLPFLVFLLSGVALTMAFDLPERLYFVRVAAMLIAVSFFVSIYRQMDWRISTDAIVAGLAVALFWVWVAPTETSENTTKLLAWLKDGPAFDEVLWLLARAVGFVLLVPLVEELAFRGYLHRIIAHGSLDGAPEATFSWRAFLITSALFGALHSRWWEGALAGALFALAMYRSGRLSNAIIAHAIANGAIFVYVLLTGHWAAL